MNRAVGWHADPAQPGIERFWDGIKWGHERPIGLAQTGEGSASVYGMTWPSTVGFELPSPEVLKLMGSGRKAGRTKRFGRHRTGTPDSAY